MYVGEYYQKQEFVFSIEIFPPKTEKGMERLKSTLKLFKLHFPDYISVTYGAGGSTRDNTHELTVHLKHQLRIEAMAHLTCVSHTAGEIDRVLDKLEASGIKNLMALRGDPPAGSNIFAKPRDGYGYASELIAAIKRRNKFYIGAAGYPEGHVENPDREADLRYLIGKVEAGADLVVSQFFLDNSHFLRWRDRLRKEGVQVPLIPGLLSPTALKPLGRMSEMCGVSIPDSLRIKLERHAGDSEAMREIGWDHTEQQIEELISDGVEGVHLYALNQLKTVERLAGPIKRAVGNIPENENQQIFSEPSQTVQQETVAAD